MTSLYRSLTPTAALHADEKVLQSFTGDRGTYIREHIKLALIAMLLGMAVLWALGNPHVWTGAVGGVFAIAVRGFYLASDDLKTRWDLTNTRLLGPQDRIVALGDIKQVRPLLSAVQVITHAGDKHLIKYQAGGEAVIAAINRAIADPGGADA